MGRILEAIDVNGRRCWTLFDTGIRISCITEEASKHLPAETLAVKRVFALGDRHHEISKACIVQASLEGNPVAFQAYVIDEIGKDEEGRSIDVLFGAIAMKSRGIKLDIENEKLDLTQLAHDIVEFAEG